MIENAAISGSRIDGRNVASVSRSRRSLTLRHRWAEHCDARVWDGVRRAFMTLAHEIADATGRSVEVYDPRGWVVEVVEPEVAS